MIKKIGAFFGGMALLCVLSLTLPGPWGCGGGGGGGGDDDAADDDADDDAADDDVGGGPVTISGAVVVAASDLAAALRLAPGSQALRALARSDIKTQAEEPSALPEADVALVKISPDGTEEEVATTTTDADGNYSFAGIDPAVGGTGAATDFYYEIRVTEGEIDIRAPAAPEADTTVDVSPETHLAAKMLSDVVDAPGIDDRPTPTPEYVEALRGLVDQNVTELSDTITVPSVLTENVSDVLATSNGIAAAGGNAESIYKAAQFNQEFSGISAAIETLDADDATAYLKRLAREGCNQQQNVNPLPILAAQELGEALMDGVTFTPAEVVEAFNAVSTGDVDVDEKTADFVDGNLTAIDETFAEEDNIEPFDSDELMTLYTKRDLDPATFDEGDPLEPDQALAFLYSLTQEGEPGPPGLKAQGAPGNPCQLGVDPTAVVKELLDAQAIENELGEPAIGDFQIYHGMMGMCDSAIEGHFSAEVDVYLPPGDGRTVTSVVIESTDSTALGGDGTVALGRQGGDATSNHFVSPTCDVAQVCATPDAGCVTLGDPVTYTITATLSDDSTIVSDPVERNHPGVPEAQTYFGPAESGNDVSGDQNNPTVTPDNRPVVTWTSPAAALALTDDAPAGSRIKYAYEFSHIRLTDDPVGPLNPDTYQGCRSVSSAGQMYEVDNFIPTVDCDVEACAASTGTTLDDIVCRYNIQTFLVDESDRLLGQAAGEFSFFCVDTDDDGDCG